MRHVLTLIADPAKEPLPPSLVEEARRRIGGAGDITWLAEGEAAEFFLEGEDPAALRARAEALLAPYPVDYSLLPAAGRRKKLLISDMDSTMIAQECIDELAELAGIGAQVAEITGRAMNGELEFKEALRHRVGLLAGVETALLARVYRERITLMPGARTLVATMRAHGAYTLLVSGGFTFFTRRVAQAIGFHHDLANTLEEAEGRLTGTVTPPILDKTSKKEALLRAAAEHGVALGETLAVGDGANDLEMLQSAGLGVGYYAKEIVCKQAHAHVAHTDLTALLYMQGYHKEECVAA
jgi:phosphoserine phosphatase